MSLDRITAPQLSVAKEFKAPEAERLTLSNGLPVYAIRGGQQDVVKIDFIFDAGKVRQNQATIAFAANEMMVEGTINKTSKQIADIFDFYGSFTEMGCYNDYASFSTYSLTRNLENILPLVKEVLTEPSFDESELNTFIINRKQRMAVSMQKTDWIAKRTIKNSLFGNNHPYGSLSQLEDYDNVSQELLQKFHVKNYNFAGCNIIISGKITDKEIKLLDTTFGQDKLSDNRSIIESLPVETVSEKRVWVEREDAMQASLAIGKVFITRTDEDFAAFQLLNLIYGGYFGSRLMKNIREDKGYTYGIYSYVNTFKQHGMFSINADVKGEVAEQAVEEIFKEIKRIKTEPIGEEELFKAKSYLSGSFLRNFDGPLNQADRLKILLNFDLWFDHYDNFIRTIGKTSTEELMNLANKYLDEDSLTTVIVGKKI